MSDPEPFGFGPAWSRGSGCCGKPAGCTNTSDACLFLNHRWKLECIPGLRERLEAERLEAERLEAEPDA